MSFVVLHPANIAELTHEDWFRGHMARIGDTVASIARTTAPRAAVHHPPPPGHGADSIHSVCEDSFEGWHARVGWDAAHFYMAFTHSHAIQEAAFAVVGR